MRLFLVVIPIHLVTSLAAVNLRGQSFEHLAGLKRQTTYCSEVPEGTPDLCAASCGPGYQTCVVLPNCFNPTVGQVCCDNGDYCPAGQYCTDGGCCPVGTSVEDCGGTQTLATVAPSSATPSGPSSMSSYSSPMSTASSSIAPVGSNSTPTSYTPPPATYTGGVVKSEISGWVFGAVVLLGFEFFM